jgi:hypothetical protein
MVLVLMSHLLSGSTWMMRLTRAAGATLSTLLRAQCGPTSIEIAAMAGLSSFPVSIVSSADAFVAPFHIGIQLNFVLLIL